jgi:hypothetical protein
LSCRALVRAAAIALCAGGLLGCEDPVHDDAVRALGGEDPRVPEGPLHRPGQPCLTCHGGSGPGEPEFSVAGTVYAGADDPRPSVGTTVEITDLNGNKFQAETNEAGNFYLETRRFGPLFPLRVALRRGDALSPMLSRIGRSGSCADCHVGFGSRSRMPAVYFREAP